MARRKHGVYDEGPWPNLSQVPPWAREQLLNVDGRYYHKGIFLLQAQASYVKTLVFTAEAEVSVRGRELIWTAIAAYYSLFHSALTVMFFLPDRVHSDLLKKLIRGRQV